MAEIPDGPARIKILKRTKSGLKFRFTSFPKHLRGGQEEDGPIEYGRNALRIKIDGCDWEIRSAACPDIDQATPYHPGIFWCPGADRQDDSDSLDWDYEERHLRKIVAAINARAGIKGRNWWGLRQRVADYRSKHVER